MHFRNSRNILPDLDEVLDALEYVSSSCPRLDWLAVGEALLMVMDRAAAFDEWDCWSCLSPCYDAREAKTEFRYLKPKLVSLKRLFRLARDAGYSRSKT